MVVHMIIMDNIHTEGHSDRGTLIPSTSATLLDVQENIISYYFRSICNYSILSLSYSPYLVLFCQFTLLCPLWSYLPLFVHIHPIFNRFGQI